MVVECKLRCKWFAHVMGSSLRQDGAVAVGAAVAAQWLWHLSFRAVSETTTAIAGVFEL